MMLFKYAQDMMLLYQDRDMLSRKWPWLIDIQPNLVPKVQGDN